MPVACLSCRVDVVLTSCSRRVHVHVHVSTFTFARLHVQVFLLDRLVA
eukprot:COSAG06_NODE_52094_length_307_cov_105.793269_2_plen_47_part_01